MRRQRELRDEIPQILLAHRRSRANASAHTPSCSLRVQRRRTSSAAARPGGLPGIAAGDDERDGRAPMNASVAAAWSRSSSPTSTSSAAGSRWPRAATAAPARSRSAGSVGMSSAAMAYSPQPRTAAAAAAMSATAPQIAADQLDPARRMRRRHPPSPRRPWLARPYEAGSDVRYGRTAQQSVQPRVQIRRADQEVQDALVEPQRAVVSRVSSSSSTSRQRRSGATGVARSSAHRRARRGRARTWGGRARGPRWRLHTATGGGVELRGGGEQDDVALEGAEPEAGDERVERGGRAHTGGGRFASGWGCRGAASGSEFALSRGAAAPASPPRRTGSAAPFAAGRCRTGARNGTIRRGGPRVPGWSAAPCPEPGPPGRPAPGPRGRPRG